MNSISNLKTVSLEQLKGNWYNAVIASLVFFAINSFVGVLGGYSNLFNVVSLAIAGPLYFGLVKYFLKTKRKETVILENLFDGFKVYVPALLLSLLMTIFTFLWALLLIVPGIIAALSYSQAFFILIDNPEISAMDALKKSKEMMNGHKWNYLGLVFSFIGWAILALLTCGIGFLWLTPYFHTTLSNFYDELKTEKTA